jgi:hypothetical protein
MPHWFVRFTSIHSFVGFAVRADATFDALNEPEREPLLSFARVTAHGAFKTSPGHCAVSFRKGVHGQSRCLSSASCGGVIGLIRRVSQTVARHGGDTMRDVRPLTDSTPERLARLNERP